jgi:hypothetical protein
MRNQNNITGPNGGIPAFNSGGNFANLTTSSNFQISSNPGVFLGIGVNTIGTTSTAVMYDGASSTCTITAPATPGVITIPGGLASLGLVAGSAVKFTNSGGGLPTGLTSNTTVYVANDTNLTATTFAVSDTQAHALAGTNQIATTGSSTGTQTVWNVSNPIGTYSTVAQGFLPVGAALTLGLIAITAGGAAANLTVLYV